MERQVFGYILVIVCIVLLIMASISLGDLLTLHASLKLQESLPTSDSDFFDAKFLYFISPGYLDSSPDWKTAVREQMADEKMKDIDKTEDGAKSREEVLEELAGSEEDSKSFEDADEPDEKLLLLILILLVFTGAGIHFLAKFITTPSWHGIIPVPLSPVLGIGFGVVGLFAFFIGNLFSFLNTYNLGFLYIGPIIGYSMVLVLVNAHMKSEGTVIWREVGFIGCHWKKAILVGVIGYFAFLPLQRILEVQGTVMAYFLHKLPEGHPFVQDFIETSSFDIKMAISVAVVFSAPFFEEIFFRGIFLQSIEQRLHPALACIICGVLFGIIHGSFISIFLITFLGIHLSFLMQKTRSVITPIVVHFMFNANGILQLLLR